MTHPVHAALQAQADAWNAGDIDAFCALCTEDVVYVGAAGTARGRTNVSASYHARYPDRAAMGQLCLAVEETRPTPSVVTLIVKWQLTRTNNEVIGGTAVLVWELRPDGWKLAVDATFQR